MSVVSVRACKEVVAPAFEPTHGGRAKVFGLITGGAEKAQGRHGAALHAGSRQIQRMR
jgi:hypothetical protein